MSFGHLNHGKTSPDDVSIVTGAKADVVEFSSGGAITAGDVVKLDITATGEAQARTVVESDASPLAIGVALETTSAAGERVRVCVAGYIEGVNCAAGAASGESLYAAANGQVSDTAAAATLPVFGVALDDRLAGGTITMYIYRNL